MCIKTGKRVSYTLNMDVIIYPQIFFRISGIQILSGIQVKHNTYHPNSLHF